MSETHINWSHHRLDQHEANGFICLRRLDSGAMLAMWPPGFPGPCPLAFDSPFNALLYANSVAKGQFTLSGVKFVPLVQLYKDGATAPAFLCRPMGLTCPDCGSLLLNADAQNKYTCSCGHVLQLIVNPPPKQDNGTTNSTT